jgi:hypothetical protein
LLDIPESCGLIFFFLLIIIYCIIYYYYSYLLLDIDLSQHEVKDENNDTIALDVKLCDLGANQRTLIVGIVNINISSIIIERNLLLILSFFILVI